MRKILFVTILFFGIVRISYGQEQKLSYFNSSLPTVDFFVPYETNVEILTALGERFTLGSSTGFVDSITVTFDSAVGDDIIVGIISDTVYKLQIGTFHEINMGGSTQAGYWDGIVPEGGVEWGSSIPVSSIVLHTPITIPVPHVSVPQNFYVVFASKTGGGTLSSAFLIRGDTEAKFVRTEDNMRSALITYDQFSQSFYTQPLDSAEDFSFAFYYGDGIYSNLSIASYVQPGSSDVAMTHRDEQNVSVYPNPASGTVHIEGLTQSSESSIHILDLLGKEVLSSDLSSSGTFDVSSLRPGDYEAIVHASDGIKTVPFVVDR